MNRRMRSLLNFYAVMLTILLTGCAVKPIAPSSESEKTTYVSPETRDPLLASYQAEFRTRIAAGGELNFPRVDGKPVYGSALLAVTISPTGTVEAVDLIQSSTNGIATHSERLIRQLQPYAVFSPELRNRAARLVLVARLNYAK